MSSTPIIEVDDVVTQLGGKTIHNGISFSVEPGTIVALIGGSGSGKSTLMREIIGLLPPSKGDVFLFGKNVWKSPDDVVDGLRSRYGVLFQHGALFSALSVAENIATPLLEQMKIDERSIRSIVSLRLALVGLSPDTCRKMPSELSGGMVKRVALARALSLEPELLFLDEPTSGLDPINARAFDHLIKTLTRSLGLTIFMATHDLDSILSIADRVLVLGDGELVADGPPNEVAQVNDPWIHQYFSSRVGQKTN